MQIDAGPGRARYFVIGDRDLAGLFGEHAGASGWRYVEQLGSAHFLEKPGYRLRVTRRAWATSFLVLVDAEIVASP